MLSFSADDDCTHENKQNVPQSKNVLSEKRSRRPAARAGMLGRFGLHPPHHYHHLHHHHHHLVSEARGGADDAASEAYRLRSDAMLTEHAIKH